MVEVPVPFGQLNEILDLDNSLGPHLPAFEIAPNFGLGKVIDVYHPVVNNAYSMNHSTGIFANDIVVVAPFGTDLDNRATFGSDFDNQAGQSFFH